MKEYVWKILLNIVVFVFLSLPTILSFYEKGGLIDVNLYKNIQNALFLSILLSQVLLWLLGFYFVYKTWNVNFF
ncbi:hypothetical protein C0583_06205 [Candidatus Parcubacteria bacterium]|nr:MAG: hypothetical protein C0583_06205 [Candidatus Parcubacteria bacterium]